MPSLEQLTGVFNQYIIGQKPRAEAVVDLSGQITRYEAQDTWALKFAARHIVPWVSDRVKAKLYASFSRGGPYLEYLPLPAVDADLAKPAMKPSRGISPKLITVMIMGSSAALFWQVHNKNRFLSVLSTFMRQWK